MILILDFDLDSGLQDINGNLLKSSVYGCFWIIVPDNKKDEFIEAWYTRRFGISDRVYETLEPVFENVVYCIMNNIEDKIDSGNYSIDIHNEIDFYNII